MKKIVATAILAMLAMAAAAWAMQPEDQSSLLLIKKGQLMKLAYVHSMTKQTAEMTARFKRFGWREPRDEECIPERPDIWVTVRPEGMYLSYTILRNGHELEAQGTLSANHPFWRMADSVMYYADKFRPPSLLHPPKP